MSQKELQIIKILNKVIQEIDFNKINSLSDSINSLMRKETYFSVAMVEVLEMIHVANDMIYGIGMGKIPGLNVEALSANPQ